MSKLREQSLKTQILIGMLILILGNTLVTGIIVGIRMYHAEKVLVESDKHLAETVKENSSASMEQEVTDRLLKTAMLNAESVNSDFEHFKRTVELIGADAQHLYNNPNDYGRVSVAPPDPANDGKISVHVTYSEATNPDNPSIVDEVGLLGNLKGTLLNANESNSYISKCYYGSETGFFIEADYDAAAKCDENGNPINYDAKSRPWYQEAVAAGKTHFTNIVREANGDRIAVMCGTPVYKGDELKGVACAGIYLDELSQLVETTDVGEGGIVIIVNSEGQLVYSSVESGSFEVSEENANTDWRETNNKELNQIVRDGMGGANGVGYFTLDGMEYCGAYAPIDAVQWALVVMLPKEEVFASTNSLLEKMSEESLATEQNIDKIFKKLILMLGIIGGLLIIVSIFIAVFMADEIVGPIILLSEKVSAIEGDNLTFEWNETVGDETRKLAESFQALISRMEGYIEEVKEVTADKERLGTELGIATRIQESALPNNFPAFPDRTDFDIYASMHPAKEVGGDFYDFFLIDENHLALVTADVSGKSIPGAMFMMVSKILIKNRSMLSGSQSPAKILSFVNQQLCIKNDADMFVTVWLAILDLNTGDVIATNAGHEYPVIKRKNGKYEYYKDKHNLPLGIMEESTYEDYTFKLEPGDFIYQYTDGVTEAANEEEVFFGMDNLLEVLNKEEYNNPKDTLEAVTEEIEKFVGDATQFDDITQLCVQYNGPSN
ncbi:SpoIIE family protein phosphatase [Pseudobutyrivibrio sp. MD2005]|uniref:SpoIIE family protein phosphatase n=1 Tax=Pseudobutyrivibrio sp. MD2005 TaxID=1410616 RepID=UPI0006876025|nr:SpoIIE family protein phosphatase [Pseudobutyrivibrio sp. MD2005]